MSVAPTTTRYLHRKREAETLSFISADSRSRSLKRQRGVSLSSLLLVTQSADQQPVGLLKVSQQTFLTTFDPLKRADAGEKVVCFQRASPGRRVR